MRKSIGLMDVLVAVLFVSLITITVTIYLPNGMLGTKLAANKKLAMHFAENKATEIMKMNYDDIVSEEVETLEPSTYSQDVAVYVHSAGLKRIVITIHYPTPSLNSNNKIGDLSLIIYKSDR